MKNSLPIILLLLLLLLGGFAINRYMDTMGPVWRDAAIVQAQIDNAVASKAAQEEIVRAHTWTYFYQGLLGFLLVLGTAGAAMYLWGYYNKRREAWARPVDGIFALQPFTNGAVHWVVDPNKSPGGITGFSKETGRIAEQINPAIGPDRQIDYAKHVQKTRTVAAAQGDNGIKYAAQAKLAAGAYDRDPKAIPLLEAPEPRAEPVKLLGIEDVFTASTYSNWPLGQNQEVGDLYTFNPQSGKPLGILGATGSGKTTYTALLIMLYALKHRYRVVILDGKGGQDWSMWDSYVEYQTLTYENILGLVDGFEAERLKRQAVLQEYGANNIWLLPKGVKLPRPTLVIVDEFGAVMSSLLLPDSKRYKTVTEKLGTLLSLVRATGIVMAFCDQYPGKWPKGMLANLDILAYRIGGMQGNAIGEYRLQNLKPGQFQVSGVVYQAWETWGTAEKLIRSIDYRKPNLLLPAMVEASGTVAPINRDDRRGEGVEATKPIVPTSPPIDRLDRITPVDDSQGDRGPIGTIGDDSQGKTYRLPGKPITQAERDLVQAEYKLQGNIEATCRALWGSWTVSRGKWVKEIVKGELYQ